MKYAVENDTNDVSLHDRILAGIPAAKWLHSESLLSNRWEIGTEDPTKKRNSTAIINFDTPVLPGLSLSDPECESDLITAKVMTYYSLSSSEGMFTTVQGAAIFARGYIQFVRWRLSRLPRP